MNIDNAQSDSAKRKTEEWRKTMRKLDKEQLIDMIKMLLDFNDIKREEPKQPWTPQWPGTWPTDDTPILPYRQPRPYQEPYEPSKTPWPFPNIWCKTTNGTGPQ